jgi:hypothetical protein
MTLLNFTDPIPFPAGGPLTSGQGSFTDPTGDIWVAKAGVNGGNWRRARDVMHARYYRTAAFTLTASAWVNLTLDTLQYDDYGLYSTSTGLFTPMITGFWRLTFIVGATPTASGQWIQPGIWESSNSSVPAADVLAHSALVYALVTQVSVSRRITTTSDTYYLRVACSAALAMQTNTDHCALEMDWVGTG